MRNNELWDPSVNLDPQISKLRKNGINGTWSGTLKAYTLDWYFCSVAHGERSLRQRIAGHLRII